MHDRTNRTPHFSEQSSFVEEILSQYSPALARSATQILDPRNIDTFQIFETFEQALQLSKRKTISNEDKKTIRFLTETLAPTLIFRLSSAINEALIEHKRLSIFKQTMTVVGTMLGSKLHSQTNHYAREKSLTEIKIKIENITKKIQINMTSHT